MTLLHGRLPVTATCTAALLAALLMTPDVGQAHPVPSAPTAPCFTDGFPPRGGGTPTGRSPVRFKWGNSPYLGARYNRCAGTVKVYYGGYPARGGLFGNIAAYSHYILRYSTPNDFNWHEARLTVGAARVATFDAFRGDWNFMVKACGGESLGQLFPWGAGRNAAPLWCTAWSPLVYLNAR
ncbi:hypothetical protein ABZ070_01630 [Streptomyces sp. NPDC006283]|uniref:hypothetical protein n=1 Tax=Streptomyces sp. NPDC006283 TaxID=3156741 RepID=UPI0033B8BA7B